MISLYKFVIKLDFPNPKSNPGINIHSDNNPFVQLNLQFDIRLKDMQKSDDCFQIIFVQIDNFVILGGNRQGMKTDIKGKQIGN